MNWTLLFADEYLVIVDKPSGLLCQPGRGPDKQDSLIGRVVQQFADARIVHRLDRDTSGVMV
ncbi:MAG: bifunctional tRNA pseudouridine(32) synthase/ribosomal large subunit pseudouridine synthase RluA, partial [Planctomycetales bacterium]|nr:bifunctional tRNA pseudouridine(32) synthase/ribosomal large subunit pseudouridine synthase RluA [Planctomycetales bacterium]